MVAENITLLTRSNTTGLDQPHSLQTRMPALAHGDMVAHGNTERGGDADDGLGHLDVSLRGRRVAAWMIVHQAAASS